MVRPHRPNQRPCSCMLQVLSLTVLFDFCECSHQGYCWTQGPNDSPYTFPNGGPSLGLAERGWACGC